MWLGNAVTSSTLHADPPSNETIDVFYIKIHSMYLTVMNVMNNAGLCHILLWPVDDASSYGN